MTKSDHQSSVPDHLLAAFGKVCATVSTEATYLRLVRACPLIPVRDDLHFAVASDLHDALEVLDLASKLDTPERACLSALGRLLNAYRREIFTIRPAAGLVSWVLRRMDDLGLSRVRLARKAGVPLSTLTSALNRSRPFTADLAAKLSPVLGATI